MPLTYSLKPGAIIVEGHIQGLSNTRSLGEAGIPVFVVDKSDCIARYSKHCKKFFRSPDFTSDNFSDFLIDIAENEKINGWLLIPSNDHAVYTISKHRNRLTQYYRILTPSLDIIENIYDKLKLVEYARKIKIPVPVTYQFSSPNEKAGVDIKFPVLTKGRNGLSFYKTFGTKALLSNNENELRKNLSSLSGHFDLTNTFTQELIPFDGSNKTISFTAFSVDGKMKTFWMGEKLREHPLQFGTATFCKSVYCEELIAPSKKLISALKYTGVCEIEYLKDPGDKLYKLIEINPRTWLWVGLAKACGVNYPVIMYNYVNNLENKYPESYITNIYWMNAMTDVVYSFKAIILKYLSFGNYIRSLRMNKVSAIFSPGDLIPSFVSPFLILLRAMNRKN